MAGESPSREDLTRRQFLCRSGVLGALTLLANVPGLLEVRGWGEPAYAQDMDLVRDTLNGLVAFILPGDDPYSVAQGERAEGPGAIAAGTTEALITDLDRFLPEPDTGAPNDRTVPLSGAIANLLNTVALSVNPVATGDTFPSAFARLSFGEKAEVFRRLEQDSGTDGELPQPFTRASGNLAFVAGILPAYIGFLAGTERQLFDEATKTLGGRPVSWQISGYQPAGPVEGWDELKGYYGGRTGADG